MTGGSLLRQRSIRLSDEEWNALQHYADRIERTPSELVRLMVRQWCMGFVASSNTATAKRNTRGDK